MSSIVSYQLTSSDESSSDENQNAHSLHLLTGVPSKKFCPEQQEETDSTPNAEGQKEDEDQEKEEEQQQLPSSGTEDETQEYNQQENEKIEGHELQGHSNHSAHVARKQSYALDHNELPGEMQTFLREIKRFFTRQVNLERQAKPLAMSTYRKAQERMLCESFRKFRENSFNDLIFVLFIYVLTRPFSCPQVS